MKRFVEGVSRDQSTLFPEKLDDFIAEDNPVRVVDAFVEAFDLRARGFPGVDPSATGRPAYHPAMLLKLYVYGYLNCIPPSRRLEREAQRNVELMWLIEWLAPDFMTIADFRKDNGRAIRRVCREFIAVCRRLDRFAQAIVAIDGSKFKAVNQRDRNFTPAKMKRRLEPLDQSIARYLGQLDHADGEAATLPEARSERLGEKIAALQDEMHRLKALEAQMLEAPDMQLSLTDLDARSMKTRGGGIVGYNVQTVVDAEHHVVVSHEVTNRGSDRRQLTTMGRQARAARGVDALTAVADRGYYKSEEILACEQAGISALLPRPRSSDKRLKGLFEREHFRYQSATDEYICPAGERLIWRFRNVEGGRTLDTYWSSACPGCALKPRCTPGEQRRIKRWEHEAILEAMQARLDQTPEAMRLRRQTAEHPFGTLKAWMGATHFLTRTLAHVRTEMSLHVLAYNLKRVMDLIGVIPLIAAVRA